MTATAYPVGWRSAGACLDSDPDLFFPISMTGPGLDQLARARKLCADCQVRRQCLEYALTSRQTFGIWGGTTPDERRRLARRKSSRDRQLARVC